MSTGVDQPCDAGNTALTRLVQKYLKKLILVLPKLQKDEQVAKKEIASLANFLEQRSSLSTAHNQEIPILDTFPDIQSKLLVKISSEIEVKVSALQTHCNDLANLHATALKAINEATALCQRYRDHLDLDSMRTGSATWPPLTVMLSWLVVIEKHLREQRCSRAEVLALLAQVDGSSVQEVINAGNLEQLWLQEFHTLTDVLMDCREQCFHFFEEKL